MGVLLACLAKQLKSQPKTGIDPGKARDHLKLTEMLKYDTVLHQNRNCAERIADLSLACSLVDDPSRSTILSPFAAFFSDRDPNIKSVLGRSSRDLALNPRTINRMLSLAFNRDAAGASYADNNEGKGELLDTLLRLRSHELALILSREFEKYEREVLRRLVDGCLGVIDAAKSEVEKTFADLDGSCKEKMLSYISVRN